MTITTLLPLWHWHKCKLKTILALVQLCTCWTAIPVWSTENRNEIPVFDSLHWHLHTFVRIGSITYAFKNHKCYLIPFLPKRFLWFLNTKYPYPWHFRNPEYLMGIDSCGQQQNAIGVTFHFPIEIIILIPWVSYSIFSNLAHEFRSTWLASVNLAVYKQWCT